MMRLVVPLLAALTVALPARAALDIGDRAPDFTASAAHGRQGVPILAGRRAQERARSSCTSSRPRTPRAARSRRTTSPRPFPQFQALGATVVGVSGDDIDTLSKFSVQACQSKFPVASDEKQNVMKSYDAVLKTRPGYANRISYVIAPDGSVVYHYMSLNPTKHVEKMLGALKAMKKYGDVCNAL